MSGQFDHPAIAVHPQVCASKSSLRRRIRQNRYSVPTAYGHRDAIVECYADRVKVIVETGSSVGITTNLAFPDWIQVFPDAMAASAIVRSAHSSRNHLRTRRREPPFADAKEGAPPRPEPINIPGGVKLSMPLRGQKLAAVTIPLRVASGAAAADIVAPAPRRSRSNSSRAPILQPCVRNAQGTIAASTTSGQACSPHAVSSWRLTAGYECSLLGTLP